MSLLSSFKKVLGFPDEYDEEPDATDVEVEVQAHANDILPADNSAQSGTNASVQPTESDLLEVRLTDAAIPGEVLDAVIKQFNATQPDFVKECLSLEAQRSFILERMETSLLEKLRAEAEEARRVGLRQCEAERTKMASDIQRMKADKTKMVRQKEEFENAQLSATRQKRALKERVTDLEQQVEQLEADREQLQLENRTLINKLRVADVKSKIADGSDVEIDSMVRENLALTDRIRQLETDLEEARKASEQSTDTQIPQEVMDEIESRLAEFEDLKQRKDKRIAELEKSLFDTISESNDSTRRLNSEIEEKDHEITDLQAEIKRLTQLINASEYQKPQNKKKIRNLNKPSASDEVRETESESAETADMPIPATETTPKISAIDELMDSTDWFTSPDPILPKKDPEVEELFGYKEPQRKPSTDNDRQLSLF